MVELRNLNDVYVALSEAIATGDVEGGRLIVETWLPVAGNDPAFISLSRAIKTMAAQKNFGTNIPGGGSNSVDKDPLGELRSEYLNARTGILEKITDLLIDDDFDAAFELFERYKPVASDDDFIGLRNQAHCLHSQMRRDAQARLLYLLKLGIKKKAKQCEDYLKALEALPEDDYPIRLNILNRIVRLVPSDENKQKLDICLEAAFNQKTISLPDKAEIENINAAMLALVSETNLIKRAKKCGVIMKYYPEYKLESMRCERLAAPILELTKKLDDIPKIDYERRMEIFKEIIKIDDSPKYKSALSKCKEGLEKRNYELERMRAEQVAKLTREYRVYREMIIKKLSSALKCKAYKDAASKLEKYYPVAKDDEKFKACINQARDAALDVCQSSIHKLKSLPTYDYVGRKALYENVLRLKPFDEYYIAQYNICEQALNAQNLVLTNNSENGTPITGPDGVMDVVAEPITVETLPEVVQNANASLKEITDKETIERVVNLLNAGAQFCTKSSDIAKKVGNFMLKYSNSPLLQLASTRVPQVSPVMNTIGNASNVIAGYLDLGAQGLSEAANNIEEIGQAFVLIVRSGANLVQSCKNLASDIVNSEGFKQFIKVASTFTSLVVGNHYMKQIGVELGEIQSTLSKISSFLESEYRGKMKRLCDDVRDMSKFNVEILENEDVRVRNTYKLEKMQDDCSDLINQANDMLNNVQDIDVETLKYEEYEGIVQDIDEWNQCLDVLISVLREVCRLKFTLNLGHVSWEQCYARYLQYEKEVSDVRAHIRAFHTRAMKYWDISLSTSNRKNNEKGFLSFFSDDYLPISKEIVEGIERQMLKPAQKKLEQVNLFQQDLRIVFKDNKLYYVADDNDVEACSVDMDWVINTLKNA